MNIPHYRYDLGQGMYVDCFSIDPEIGTHQLEEMLREKDGTGVDPKTLAPNFKEYGSFQSFNDLKIRFSTDSYMVPSGFDEHRDAIGEHFDNQFKIVDGKKVNKYKNGPVGLVDGEVSVPLELFRGGYYDFKATELSCVPSDFSDNYPHGKTIEDFFNENGLNHTHRARYLGITYLLTTDSGENISTIHRQKGLLVAPDCIATPGSTPPYDIKFSEPDFDFHRFYSDHIAQEMHEEFKLSPNEFEIKGIRLLDEPRFIPYFAVEVNTKLPSTRVVKRIHGNKDAISEHPIAYFANRPSTQEFINRFPVFPGCQFALHRFLSD
ncbi:hypothetical protein GOV12_02955 [Candidatus Pacearchaeota archaeon]|nr:hypothetical protein [Candidatus Pacearchaeota archaeon]